MSVTIRLATPADLDDVLGVLDDAAAWLQSIGMTEQWPASVSSDPAWVERFQRWIGEGRVFIALNDHGDAIGCFRLMNEDVHIWPDDSRPSVYLHSLAVRRSAAKSGVAVAMLDWAFVYAASKGVEELRLDCWAGNGALRRYYKGAGFEDRGVQMVASEPSGEHSHLDYFVAKFARRLR